MKQSPPEFAEPALPAAVHIPQQRPDTTGTEIARLRRHVEALEAELARATRAAVDARESATVELAAELHDTVVQSLLLLQWEIDAESDRSVIAERARLAERQLRGVLANAQPPQLRGGLSHALRQALGSLHAEYGVMAIVADWPTGPMDLPDATLLCLYRFYQEGLRNVAKHSGCRFAKITLQVDPVAGITATVTDTGQGMTKPPAPGHLGLTSMRARAQRHGGELLVESEVGRGTRLTLKLPGDRQQS